MDLPPEYVLHLLPLMAICGIPPPQPPPSSPNEKRTERSSSFNKPGSPRPAPTLASIPYIDQDLGRAILKIIDQWRTLALWEPFASKDRQVPGASLEGMFRVIPVDRSFRLPPQKARSAGDAIVEREKELHSPLSPLTPESPLYPDGIMTTMWIRKHRDIIPSVFVSFYELKSEEKPQNISDEDLARHLVELKKSYAERGVKLCAVLTGPWEADEISTRLEYLRRNATLDFKTGLFYLPSPQSETYLQEFFKSLRQTQYPFAIDHYRLRFNKTKRRRPKIPSPIPNHPAPLDAKGWSVRTNYKLAAYSEYKQELDVAAKFYELAYTELMDLFSSTAILPPRSKRWQEARVLADSISYKLCKLLLYLGDHTRCIQLFNAHNKRMSTLCNGWGLGVETAEYWHWLARNFRVFADLLDISETIIVGEQEIEEATKMMTGDMIVNVDQVLHHPGYYYLNTADCVRQEHSRLETTAETAKEGIESGIFNGALFENLSLSAEHFGKRGSRRTVAYIELERCMSHHFAGKFDVALELLRPVIQIYRGEQWYQLLEEALLLALDCARRLGDDESILRYSLELLSNEFCLKTNHDAATIPSLISTPTTAQNTAKPEITINATEFVSFVNPSFTFQSKSAFAGSLVSFQLALQSQARKSVPEIVIRSARLSFNEQIPEILITHSHSDAHGVQTISPNASSGQADLSLQPGQNRVLEFSFTPIAQAQIEVLTLHLSLETDSYIFTIKFSFPEISLWTDGFWYTGKLNAPKVLRLGNPRQLTVLPKPPKVAISTTLHGPAYVGERLPIEITLENGEDETVTLEIQHESPDVEGNPQQLFSWHPEATSTRNILSVGKIRQGERHQCTLMFNAPSTPSDHTLNLIMKYTLESDGMTEIRTTLSLDVPVIQPFHTIFDILPRIAKDGGMPDPFSEGGYSLGVSQSWLLVSSITRLGSEKLELQHLGVDGTSVAEDHNFDIQEVEGNSSPSEPLPVLDSVPHTNKTVLTLTRANDTDTTVLQLDLAVTWRRQSSSQTYEWNTISIRIPELTFFPFAPRILADVAPHTSHSDHKQYLITYTFENPTCALLHIDAHFESSDECGFAGAKTFGVNLFAFTTYELKVIVIPIVAVWARLPRLQIVTDDERKMALEILRMTDDLKVEGQDLFLRVPVN